MQTKVSRLIRMDLKKLKKQIYEDPKSRRELNTGGGESWCQWDQQQVCRMNQVTETRLINHQLTATDNDKRNKTGGRERRRAADDEL